MNTSKSFLVIAVLTALTFCSKSDEAPTCKYNATSPSNLVSNYSFSHDSDGTVSMTMLGREKSVILTISMPGVQVGPFDIGGDSKPSTMYRSEDQKTFKQPLKEEEKDGFKVRKANGLQPSPVDKESVIVVGYDASKKSNTSRSTLWISRDAGKNWTMINLTWRLDDKILFHPWNKTLLLAYSRSDNFAVYLSEDFGTTWNRFADFVRAFHWGYKGETIFYSRDYSVGVYRSDPNADLFRVDLKADGRPRVVVAKHVHSFGLEGKFLYASIIKDAHHRLLTVSIDQGDTWHHAELPDITLERFYSILDMCDDMIFLHVANPRLGGRGTLYTSGDKGEIFSESLENHLFTTMSQTDFYHVKGIKGVFLASQVNDDSTIRTMISYNRGASWGPLPRPKNKDGTPVPCPDKEKTCSLQLHISYSVSQFLAAPMGPLSIENATGLIISHGHVGESLETTGVEVFVSSDGGHSWQRTGLKGSHLYRILEYGGIIVALNVPDSPRDPNPRSLLFSTDEGESWSCVNFTDKDIKVRGLEANPDAHSALVNIWGTEVDKDEWIVFTVDFHKVLTRKCEEKDYEPWNAPGGCYLGVKTTYKRQKKKSVCDIEPKKLESVSEPCPCTKSDYHCEYGYERKGGDDCIRSNHLPNSDSAPKLCLDGKVYKVENQKFRKIPGDKCDVNKKGAFVPPKKKLMLLNPERSCVAGDKSFLAAPTQGPPKTQSQKMALAAIILVSLLLFSVLSVFFVRKFLILGRENGSFRYSRVSTRENGEEFESLLPQDATSTNIFSADEDEDFDLEMELERGLASLGADLATPFPTVVGDSPPELPVSASKSPVKSSTPSAPRSAVFADSDDDELIA